MSNVPCYRLQTFIWHIRGVTWRRKSLNTCREAPLCAERFQSHKFPGCSVVPCPVARSMCSHMWQSSGPVPWHQRREGWRCFSMSVTWRWCLGNCLGGRIERIFCSAVLLTYLHRCDQSTVSIQHELSAVALHSSQFSKFGSQQGRFRALCGRLG